MPPKGGADDPRTPSGTDGQGREVIFEFKPVGGSMKVVAVDVASGVEVTVIGPVHAPQRELERVAMQKLKHRLGLDRHSKPDGKGSSSSGGRDDTGGGILV